MIWDNETDLQENREKEPEESAESQGAASSGEEGKDCTEEDSDAQASVSEEESVSDADAHPAKEEEYGEKDAAPADEKDEDPEGAGEAPMDKKAALSSHKVLGPGISGRGIPKGPQGTRMGTGLS